MSDSPYFLPAEIAVMTLVGTVAYLLMWRWAPREKETARRHNGVFYSLLITLITGSASVFILWLYRYTPPTKINIFSASVLGILLMLLPLKRLADLILADRPTLRIAFLTVLFSGYVVYWGLQILSRPKFSNAPIDARTNFIFLIVLGIATILLVIGRAALRRK